MMESNELVASVEDGFSAAMGAGAALGELKECAGVPFVVVPDGYQVENLETMLPAPVRRKSIVSLENVESFCAFVKRYNEIDQTVLFADLESKKFTAVLDYHGGASRVNGWGGFRAVLFMQSTYQWKRWMENNRVDMNQLDFADFVEANIKDIAEPDGAEIMEMVTALKVRKKAEFISVVDQATGMKSVQYSEETRGESTKGNIDFFGEFTLGLRPFLGSDVYAVPCRLRFSITVDNKLRIFYHIINHEAVAEAAFNTELEKIGQSMAEVNIPIFNGMLSS